MYSCFQAFAHCELSGIKLSCQCLLLQDVLVPLICQTINSLDSGSINLLQLNLETPLGNIMHMLHI